MFFCSVIRHPRPFLNVRHFPPLPVPYDIPGAVDGPFFIRFPARFFPEKIIKCRGDG